MQTTDFLIIGGGVIGLSIARQLEQPYTDPSATIFKKNPQTGYIRIPVTLTVYPTGCNQ